MKDHLERLSHPDTSTSSQTRKKSLSEILATSRGKEHKSAESLQLEHQKWEQAEYHARVEAAEEMRGLPPSPESKVWLGHDKKRYAGIGGMTDREWERLDDNITVKRQWHANSIGSIFNKHTTYQDAIDIRYYHPSSSSNSNNERREELEELNDTLKALRIQRATNIFHYGKFPNETIHNQTTPSIKPSYQDSISYETTVIRRIKQELEHKLEIYR